MLACGHRVLSCYPGPGTAWEMSVQDSLVSLETQRPDLHLPVAGEGKALSPTISQLTRDRAGLLA